MSYIKDYLMDIEEGRVIPGELQDKYVCSNHFSDKYLSSIIEQSGDDGKCSYCGSRSKVMSMPDFISLINKKLNSEFEDVNEAGLPTESSYFDDDEEILPGLTRFCGFTAPENCEMYEDTEDALDEILEITDSEGLRNDVLHALPHHAWISHDPFVVSLDEELNIKWKHFADMVKHKQRFTFLANDEFAGKPSEYDNGLFDILTEIGSMIYMFNVCNDIDEDTIIYRARPITEDTPLTFEQITCPPDDKAKQNRMSPAGISMFYGTFDEETARRECTPESGHDGKGRFLIGRFKKKQPLLLINLTSLPKMSYWHQTRESREALAFMNIFHNTITKSIKPDERIHMEYIPSQVFTEYLRYMFKLEGNISVDGMIYKSSVNEENCIVLFCNQKDSEKMLELVDVEDKKY